MDIFDYMDCEGCAGYRYEAERLTEDAYFSTPCEVACADGDFGERHPCARMLAALEGSIRAGGLTTEDGAFYTAAAVEAVGGNQAGHRFWWVSDAGDRAQPYDSLSEIYDAWFS